MVDSQSGSRGTHSTRSSRPNSTRCATTPAHSSTSGARAGQASQSRIRRGTSISLRSLSGLLRAGRRVGTCHRLRLPVPGNAYAVMASAIASATRTARSLSRGSTRTTPPAGTEVAAPGRTIPRARALRRKAGVRISAVPSSSSLALAPRSKRARPALGTPAFVGVLARPCATATPRRHSSRLGHPDDRLRVEARAGESRAKVENSVAHAAPALPETKRPDSSAPHSWLARAFAQKQAPAAAGGGADASPGIASA
jgi:hypothetical protein